MYYSNPIVGNAIVFFPLGQETKKKPENIQSRLIETQTVPWTKIQLASACTTLERGAIVFFCFWNVYCENEFNKTT